MTPADQSAAAPPELWALFRCPACRGHLREDDASLRCETCDRQYPIVGGIPRFVGDLQSTVEQVQRAFDFEHRRYERSALTQFGPHLIDQFLDDCRIRPDYFEGRLTLDAGCGSGRWTYALAHLGARVTAVDLTAGGVESAFGELGSRDNTSFAQANIFQLPFEPETFEFVMSWGVLHHTPDTRAAFDRLVPLVRPGGTLYVMVYEKLPALLWNGTQALRHVLRRMPEDRRYDFCRHLVIDSRAHPWRLRLLSRMFMVAAHDPESNVDPETYQFGLFDAYSPTYNHVHTRGEVAEWFREAGFGRITVVDSPFGAVKVRGVKTQGVRARPRAPRSLAETGSIDATWVHAFKEKHGRAPRVLHLGNIANNAYINAKIQRREGIDADAVSYDYYHVMSCPEWEDAAFVGEVDENFPDWWATSLAGWQRPRWFVQGPLETCVAYLNARLDGNEEEADAKWAQLSRETWQICRRSQAANAVRLASTLAKALRRPGMAASRAGTVIQRTSASSSAGARAAALAWRVELARRKSSGGVRAAKAIIGGMPPRRALARYVFPSRLADALTQDDRRELEEERAAEAAATNTSVDDVSSQPRRDDLTDADRAEPLVGRFLERFPERRDVMTLKDLGPWKQLADLWRPVFERYDVVQAYATYPIIPLAAGVESFAAYEHGTLRDIPFEVSARGRITALGYREAPVVFVTNADDLNAAERLGIPSERVVALPHAVDTQRLDDFAATNSDVAPPPDAQATFFAPARHDWVAGFTSELKGNDRVVRAVKHLLDEGEHVNVVFVDWGRHASDTRRLIEELGCASAFTWLAPLRKDDLWARYLSSHAVLDQFVMGAIGGVTFEAMALGCRVITALDHEVNARFFGEAPPVLAAQTPEEIAAAMRAVVDDLDDAAERGRRNRDWIAAFHSSERVVGLQVQSYERLLSWRT